MTVDKVMSGAVHAALTRASAATGVDFALLSETARRESGYRADAAAPTSSARGLFQFIEGTWLEMVARHGAKHGLEREAAAIDLSSGRPRVTDAATREAILALRHDPELSARMAGELARENAQSLSRALGRGPSASELYAAHVLGAGGAAKLVKAAEAGAGDAAALFPEAAAANRWLFYDRAGVPRSAQGLLDRLAIDVDRAPAGIPTAPADRAPAPASSPTLTPELWRALIDLPGFSATSAGAGDTAPEIALLRALAYQRLR